MDKNIVSDIEKLPTVIAGPCVIESYDNCAWIADELKNCCDRYGFNLVFKSSYDKANRSDSHSFRGPGLNKGLKILERIKREFDVEVTSDIHESNQAKPASEVLDIIQIPAFLCRQTDLLKAATKYSDRVNIKKGQFIPPYKVQQLVSKLKSFNDKVDIIVTERGNQFGYSEYIVDFPSLISNISLDCKICLDITHSTQKISPNSTTTLGSYKDAFVLAKCAAVNGISIIFLETHPNPKIAKSDKESMIPLDELNGLLEELSIIYSILKTP